ncbi:co-chaperone GroES [Periweissella cryptocerci]|uniref:Co-chaperonin GroES n=1 Tax=Periweissella cryptocerci TaxID=2506420 RepID=A0A4P6YUX2_9LACO|nr:co-chaperone GroES [Periweissella cryptocerci]QBO36562.1 co-chaperone GroES [Periweissella cryptocerci]
MLKPLGDRVILQLEKKEEETFGGIVIAGGTDEKPTTAKVIAVGAGYLLQDGTLTPLSVKAGDIVLFDKFAGNEIKHDGEDFLVVHEKDIIAIVD